MPHQERSFPADDNAIEEGDVVDEPTAKRLSAYQQLEQQVTQLSTELSAIHRVRSAELLERERLTQRLSLLLAALPAGVIVIDGNGVIKDSNPAAQRLFDIPLATQLWRHIIEQGFQQDALAGSDAILTSGRVVSISTCPLGTEPGQIVLLLDVTETRVLQTTLERHKRLSAIGEVASKVAHQIRTPLASALLYVSNLVKYRLSDQDKMRFAEKALMRLKHLETVVEDMLAITRGGSATNKAVISLADLFSELCQIMEPHVQAASGEFHIAITDKTIRLLANKDALLSSLQNLINNALQACDAGGVIELSTERVAEHQGLPAIDIIIADNGPGLSEPAKAHLFEPFFTTRANGTGLGLSVVKSVINTHGGSIWLDNRVAKGACFVIRLPLHR